MVFPNAFAKIYVSFVSISGSIILILVIAGIAGNNPSAKKKLFFRS
jgi:hypothetical protein